MSESKGLAFFTYNVPPPRLRLFCISFQFTEKCKHFVFHWHFFVELRASKWQRGTLRKKSRENLFSYSMSKKTLLWLLACWLLRTEDKWKILPLKINMSHSWGQKFWHHYCTNFKFVGVPKLLSHTVSFSVECQYLLVVIQYFFPAFR